MHPRSKRVVVLTSVAILTIAVLAVFLVPTALASDAFPDVPDSHWAHDFISWLFNNGITSGFPDGTYRPDNNVTRAEMAVFIQQVAGAGSAGPVTDADKLDGLDSSAFLQKGTRRLVVPGSAFFGDEETHDWSHSNYSGAVTCVTSCTVVAPVQLPHGATVTRVIWYYGSTAVDNADLHLESNDFTGGHDDMVSMDLAACATEPCSVSESTVSPDVINNDGRSYGLWLTDFTGGHTTFAVIIVYDTTTTTTAPALPAGANWKGDGSSTN